jgi:hypothetical protein
VILITLNYRIDFLSYKIVINLNNYQPRFFNLTPNYQDLKKIGHDDIRKLTVICIENNNDYEGN